MNSWDKIKAKHINEIEQRDITRHDTVYTRKAEEIIKQCKTNQAVLYVANAGDGKSRVAGEIPNEVNKLQIMQSNKRCVFCTNTRHNRDEFAKNNPMFVVVKGAAEVIGECTSKAIEQAYNEEYKARLALHESKPEQYGMPKRKEILKHLMDIGYITFTEMTKINDASHVNNKKIEEPYVCMTSAKLRVGDIIKRYSGRYIMIDESTINTVLSVAGKVETYSNCVTNVEVDEHIERFINNVNDMTKNDPYTNVILFSAEKSLKEAFISKNMPVVDSVDVGEPVLIKDPNLHVLVLKDTSEDFSEKIAKTSKQLGYQVIADGIESRDYSFEAAKGSNELMQVDLVTILRHPHPTAFAPYMTALDIGQDDALRMYSSDAANQAIGRNTGYRSKGGKHVLVLNRDMYDKGLIELDTVGEVHICTRREQVDALPDGFLKDLCGELYNGNDMIVSRSALAVITDVMSAGIGLNQKGTVIRELAKAHLLEQGATDNRIRKEGLVKAVIDRCIYLGMKEVIIKKVKYYSYQI
ncbi:hypothetical protein VIBRN418_01668 [Vibrio sp. N418]|uniref:hypothetical protein n=1 Tax=Vibrio sp. (strain N418) TaxID=701176 RepID=UPI00021C0772|nr:hypothetical protein [Vibrio sp. N418]EGU31490.1 hypothetical protein VIBRN418_01668 [Vibrio sp. N418]